MHPPHLRLRYAVGTDTGLHTEGRRWAGTRGHQLVPQGHSGVPQGRTGTDRIGKGHKTHGRLADCRSRWLPITQPPHQVCLQGKDTPGHFLIARLPRQQRGTQMPNCLQSITQP